MGLRARAEQLRQIMSDAALMKGYDDEDRNELEAVDHYGLDSYGIMLTIPDLTHQLMMQLERYYSPNQQEREEYEVEVALMAVLRTLVGYVTHSKLATGLVAPSATSRFDCYAGGDYYDLTTTTNYNLTMATTTPTTMPTMTTGQQPLVQ